MIRKLNEADRESLIEYLKPEAEINLFIIGDVEHYGFDSDFQEIWADFSETKPKQYEAVLLRYYNNYILYTHNSSNYDYSSFTEKLNNAISNKSVGVISAKKQIIDKLCPNLNIEDEYKIKHQYYLKCEKIDPDFPVSFLDNVKYATTNDVSDIAYLLDEKIEEFAVIRNIEAMKKGIESGFTKIVYMKNDNSRKIIATATSTAENKFSAMIIGVATDPDYRKMGYASACMYKLTKDLIDNNKTACLFYDNPKAGSIYKKLGFEQIDGWSMLVIENDNN